MNIQVRLFSLLLPVLLTGCGAQYLYSGTATGPDSYGDERHYAMYWSKTERPLWFDTTAGSVTVLTQCSTNAIQFDERATGILFLQRLGNDEEAGGSNPAGGVCGKILNASKIEDLHEGILRIKVECRPITDGFSVRNSRNTGAYPGPGEIQFTVRKNKTENLLTDAPKAPVCEE